jgi:hypothetical protein
MFRFGNFRAASTQAMFANGAKSVFYMNQWMSRRHCARAHTPLVGGFFDTKAILGDCALRSQITAIQSGSLSVFELSQLMALCSGGAALELSALFSECGAVPTQLSPLGFTHCLLSTFSRAMFRSHGISNELKTVSQQQI